MPATCVPCALSRTLEGSKATPLAYTFGSIENVLHAKKSCEVSIPESMIPTLIPFPASDCPPAAGHSASAPIRALLTFIAGRWRPLKVVRATLGPPASVSRRVPFRFTATAFSV